VHFVDEGTDTGPAVLQREVPVEPGDTVETLSRRILEAEHRAYPEAIARVLDTLPPLPEPAQKTVHPGGG
jgi:phosphoribosylglycinamide formyltransferase-1